MIKVALSKIIRFFCRLLSKIIYLVIPTISRILITLRLHSRVINQLNKLRSESHKIDDHRNFISKLLNDNKLLFSDITLQYKNFIHKDMNKVDFRSMFINSVLAFKGIKFE